MMGRLQGWFATGQIVQIARDLCECRTWQGAGQNGREREEGEERPVHVRSILDESPPAPQWGERALCVRRG
ncbi:hypothetical protein AA103581_1468 [Gluconobacter wancherniae NBRC 103581]|nr:hypothetical protein AA103581_1468 [Gluconobacter wancherniae NBRC 103581]